MNTRIIIVRHTETIGNIEKRLTGRQDYKITENGKKAIEKLTQRLKNIKFDKIYSSTSGRAINTITPIAILNNSEIETDENLCEMYFGEYDGWKWEDVNKINYKIKQTQNEINEIEGIKNQETMKQVEKRMVLEITRIAKENLGKTILISSHGVAIESFLRWITKEPFNINREKHSQHNTSVNELIYNSDNGEFKIIVLNDISHLNKEKGAEK